MSSGIRLKRVEWITLPCASRAFAMARIAPSCLRFRYKDQGRDELLVVGWSLEHHKLMVNFVFGAKASPCYRGRGRATEQLPTRGLTSRSFAAR